MTARVTLDISDQIALIRFSNPPDGFMDDDTVTGLTEALGALQGARVVILTGADPGVFIRHFDVTVLEARGRALRDRGYTFAEDRPLPEPPLHAAMRAIGDSPLPFIAAINGTAMGGGFELALACDIRLAEAGAHWLGLPEVNLGLLPGAGGTQRLPRLIGEAKALEFMLTGRTVRPAEAAALGLVSACVDGPVLDAAMEMAQALKAKPAPALAHIKRLVRKAPDPDAMAAERTLFADLMVSDDAIDLMARMNAGGTIRDPGGTG